MIAKSDAMKRQDKSTESTVLAEANRLAGAGLRQAALDILLEYLSDYPGSPKVLAVVGRLYLLDKKPEKSIKYLQLSLRLSEVAKSNSRLVDAYDDSFDDEDLKYVDEQNTQIATSGFVDQSELSKPENDSVISAPEDGSGNIEPRDIVVPLPTPVNNSGGDELSKIPPVSTSSSSDPEQKELDLPNTEIDFAEGVFLDEDAEECSPTIEQIIEREGLAIDITPSDADSLEDDDEFVGVELYPDASIEALPDEAYELSWEEIDDLDQFTLQTQNESGSVLGNGKLSRKQRARQVAVNTIEVFDLDRDFLPLLQTIFYENGWGAARVAIERELLRGASREEIGLAREIRHFWQNSERYWVSFRALYRNGISNQTVASYRNMSWAEALRLVACFPEMPCIEEVEVLIEEAFTIWYDSHRLRRSFPVFFKFLKYRTASMPGTLPRTEPFYFDLYLDDGVEDFLVKDNAEDEELRRLLWDLGVDLNKPCQERMRYVAHPEALD